MKLLRRHDWLCGLVRRIFLLLNMVVLLHVPSSYAIGMLSVSSQEIQLNPRHQLPSLFVQNIGDAPLFLDVDQQLLLNPGQQPERLVPVEDVPDPALLVVPRRLVLAPGQRYRMNLRAVSVPEYTHVWRVTFYSREHMVVEADAATESAGGPVPLAVSLAYGVLVYQWADKPEEL